MKLNSFGMNLYPKRYENTTRVFLKNSGFSYLYGSVSYLFGYEKNRCFSLMNHLDSASGGVVSVFCEHP